MTNPTPTPTPTPTNSKSTVPPMTVTLPKLNLHNIASLGETAGFIVAVVFAALGHGTDNSHAVISALSAAVCHSYNH